jgi:hypothetical protein
MCHLGVPRRLSNRLGVPTVPPGVKLPLDFPLPLVVGLVQSKGRNGRSKVKRAAYYGGGGLRWVVRAGRGRRGVERNDMVRQ